MSAPTIMAASLRLPAGSITMIVCGLNSMRYVRQQRDLPGGDDNHGGASRTRRRPAGLPLWYEDAAGTRVELCLDNANCTGTSATMTTGNPPAEGVLIVRPLKDDLEHGGSPSYLAGSLGPAR
jgi:hypothetical protein